MTEIWVAIIAAITSLIVAIVSQYLVRWRERKNVKEGELKRVQLEYLNPLRLFLVENHFRLSEIRHFIEKSDNKKCDSLLSVDNPHEIIEKDDAWFNGEGCYLMSSVYLTACLFSCLDQVRKHISFLAFSKTDDTNFITLCTKVSIAFSGISGVFYITQFSLGQDLYDTDADRLISYREFCSLLKNEQNVSWFYQLIYFYLKFGKGDSKYFGKVTSIINAIQELSAFLDKVVGGGESLKQRFQAENIEGI